MLCLLSGNEGVSGGIRISFPGSALAFEPTVQGKVRSKVKGKNKGNSEIKRKGQKLKSKATARAKSKASDKSVRPTLATPTARATTDRSPFP